MSQSWSEHFEWLSQQHLKWPAVPPREPVKAKPSLAPLEGIRAVVWSLYGTLIRVHDGELRSDVDDRFRMQIAFEKTLERFNMWTSMVRKPGAPWEYLSRQYLDILEELRLSQGAPKGDFPHIDSSALWRKILSRLMKKEYSWDRRIYGSEEELADRISFFYHASLQGFELTDHSYWILDKVRQSGRKQGLWADTQAFSYPQLLRHLGEDSGKPDMGDLFDSSCCQFSHLLGVRKPSQSFYKTGIKQLAEAGISPQQTLYISNVLKDDLSIARSFGLKTALLVNDRLALRATASELRDEQLRPDRLLTEIDQVTQLLTI